LSEKLEGTLILKTNSGVTLVALNGELVVSANTLPADVVSPRTLLLCWFTLAKTTLEQTKTPANTSGADRRYEIFPGLGITSPYLQKY
jgi:hypothetical protein